MKANKMINVDPDSGPEMTREEYLTKLNKWLDDARLWHGFCAGLPYYMTLQNQNQGQDPNLGVRMRFNNFSLTLNETVFGTQSVQEYVIPPLWKRFVAECFDFFILLIIKMPLTFLLLETLNLVSTDQYGFEFFQENLQNPKVAMQISMELLTVEILHKVIVCVYESYFLKGGRCATPGKRLMGLMVICAENVDQVNAAGPQETVRVISGTALGIQKSVFRALFKNLFFGLMLPLCSFYIFRFNRFGYDMIANSLVVETNENLPPL